MAAKRRFWKKTWPEFFRVSPDVRLVVMVAVARLSGQIGRSMETFVQNFQNWRLVVPLFSAWGFGQIQKRLVHNFVGYTAIVYRYYS